MTVVPDLDRWSGSWVATSPNGKPFEFYSRRNVEALAAHGWRIETAHDYLCRINTEIKEANP